MSFDFIFNSAEQDRLPVLIGSLGLCGAVALVDWKVLPDVSLGLLYIFPVLVASLVLTRTQIAFLAAGCSMLREDFGYLAWQQDWPFRLVVVWVAFLGAGLFVAEYRRNRLQTQQYREAIAVETGLRLQQEQLLGTLVETSPLGIMVFGSQGAVEMANQAAGSLFGYDALEMRGMAVRDLVPALASALSATYAHRDLKAALECYGRTRDGVGFVANVWFSTFKGPSGRRMAAVLWDQSESLRSREVASWNSLVASTRIALGSALHELRNYSRQAAEVQRRLLDHAGLADSAELHALGTVVQGIEEIAAGALRTAARDSREVAHLGAVMEEMRILADPTLAEEGIRWSVELPPEPPSVQAAHQALLQVLLNLLRNARRELEDEATKDVLIEVRRSDNLVLILVSNSGAPVEDAGRLFRPFASGSNSAGLGLFVSQALLRSSGGDLRYETRAGRPYFVIELMPAEVATA